MIPVIGLAMIIGITLGLFGGGGGILTVPLLHYGLAMPVDQAITTSLLIICITSIVATSQYAKQKYVLWREGSLLGFSGIVGAVVGAQLSVLFPSQALLLMLAAMMLASSIAMLCNKNEILLCNLSPTKHSPVTILAIGLVVGIVTGMVGAGGGFLVVPALVVFLSLPLPIAIGTSLFVISLNTASGFIAHYQNSTLDVKLIAIISLLAVVGTLNRRKNRDQDFDKYAPKKFFFVHYFSRLIAYCYRVTDSYSARLVSTTSYFMVIISTSNHRQFVLFSNKKLFIKNMACTFF